MTESLAFFDSLPLWGLILFGGLMHALDADHLLAVSGQGIVGAEQDAEPRSRQGRTALHLPLIALRWAGGHGLALTLICVLVVALGLSVPHQLSAIAERLVGCILLATGITLLWVWAREKRGNVPLQAVASNGRPSWIQRYRPALVGVTQGMAGSAPLLMVLPLAAQQQFGLALIYILLFSLAVALMMCLVGGAFGLLVSKLKSYYSASLGWLRFALGVGSIGLGFLWLTQA